MTVITLNFFFLHFFQSLRMVDETRKFFQNFLLQMRLFLNNSFRFLLASRSRAMSSLTDSMSIRYQVSSRDESLSVTFEFDSILGSNIDFEQFTIQ